LGKDSDLVLVLSYLFASELLKVAFEFFVLVADKFELVLEFAHLSSRKAQGLLGVSDLVVKVGIF
jgi:hypothetical protein